MKNIYEIFIRQKDYPLRPNVISLRPDKLEHISFGLSCSPEGWYDCCVEQAKDKTYYTWGELCWTIDHDKKLYFWVKFLHLTDKPIEQLSADAFCIQLVDKSDNTMGYGPLWFRKIVYSIDDIFSEIVQNEHLKKVFFDESNLNTNQLVLNKYSKIH